MEKSKKVLKKTATTKIKWIILVAIILIIIVISAIVAIISNNKAKAELAKANAEAQQESVIKQEDLVSTAKMSEEELKKLNEEELKKAEEKEKEEAEKNKTTTTKPVKNKYYIKVNYGSQVVTIYTYDKDGNYTVPVKACICSTGAETPTSGVYSISWKAVWGLLYGNVWGHYTCRIVGDILFHSVPYKQAQNDTLVSAYYDRLGSKDSMGCVRLTTADAKWIYDNCPSGTKVEFYSSSTPGPLGKPTAIKVSDAPGDLKNWDPTDPDPKNPWIEYLKEQSKNQNNTNNEENNINQNTQTNNTIVNNVVENNEEGSIGNNLIENNQSNEENPIENNLVENNEMSNNQNTEITNTEISNEQTNTTNETIYNEELNNEEINEPQQDNSSAN